LVDAMVDPAELEKLQVNGAIRTDLILSAEIMAIALASLEHLSLAVTAVALVAVAFAITAGVYGVVALIVKLDDIGLHMAQRGSRSARTVGEAIVHVVPKMLTSLSAIGTAAMLWVGGGILLHGLEEMGVAAFIPEAVHHLAHAAGAAAGALEGAVSWLVNALGGALLGLVVGGAIAAVVRQVARHPEELIVD
jgi:predicted DNA repair protein MutK